MEHPTRFLSVLETQPRQNVRKFADRASPDAQCISIVEEHPRMTRVAFDMFGQDWPIRH